MLVTTGLLVNAQSEHGSRQQKTVFSLIRDSASPVIDATDLVWCAKPRPMIGRGRELSQRAGFGRSVAVSAIRKTGAVSAKRKQVRRRLSGTTRLAKQLKQTMLHYA